MKTLLDYYVSRCAVVTVAIIAAVLLIVTASSITLLGSYWNFIVAASTALRSIKRSEDKTSVFPLQRFSRSVSHSRRIGDGELGPLIVTASEAFGQKGAFTIDDFVRFCVAAQRMLRPTIDSEGPYRLLCCSSKNNKAGVLQELEKGVEPNLADYDKRTALHLASCEGCTEVVVLLLEKGANVNSIDRWGRTPLSDARSCGHEDICKILMAHGGIDPVGLDAQNPYYEIDFNEVDMEGAILIGEGAFGEVYRVKWRGTEVAAKTIRSSIASNPRVRSDFMKELALWQKLRHPNIVQFLGVLKQSDRLIFLTEYLRNGSLFDILRKRGRLDPQTAVAYALDIARGMNYLHQHKPHAIIHRDLTPRNVLQDESGHLKVTDFGLSKIALAKDAESYKMTGCTGSYRYMAPEVYRRESYGKSVDVFSFAMIVYEMFYGGPSGRTQTPEQVADKRAYEDYRPPLSSYVYPELFRVLLRECWHKNPDCRPTFEEIIPQLEKIQESMLYDKTMRVCCSCAIS